MEEADELNPIVIGCSQCGAPLRVLPGQVVVRCPYCQGLFFYNNQTLDAVVLAPQVDAAAAKRFVLQGLRHPEVDRDFLSRSFFESAVLFFLPFREIRGVRAGKKKREKESPAADNGFTAGPDIIHVLGPERKQNEPGSVYVYNSFQYLASEFALRDFGFIDISLVEEAMLRAKQMTYDPARMRQLGVVIAPSRAVSAPVAPEPSALPLYECTQRLVYFPVWEIAYSADGILFKNYVSALDGQCLKIQALKNRRASVVKAVLGLAVLGITSARLGRLGVVMLPTFFQLSILLIPASLFLLLLFTPYFWQLFAFREIVDRYPGFSEAKPIQYEENSFSRLMNRLMGFFIKAIAPTKNE